MTMAESLKAQLKTAVFAARNWSHLKGSPHAMASKPTIFKGVFNSESDCMQAQASPCFG